MQQENERKITWYKNSRSDSIRATRSLSMKLKRYCRVNEVKVKELAEMLGISMSYLSNLMYEGRHPSKDLAEKIYQVTDGQVTEEDLFSKDICPHCGKDIHEKPTSNKK